MLIKLFNIEGGKPVPSEHCYTLGFLKDIMNEFPEDQSIQIYQYLFYMTCPDPDINPCFHLEEIEKEEFILREVRPTFYVDDMKIDYALARCRELYETPTARSYYAAKAFLDRLTYVLRNEEIVTGRDGNGAELFKYAKELTSVRRSFQEAFKDMKEEFGTRGRGGREMSYDEDDD